MAAPRLAEWKLYPIPIEIELEPLPLRPAMPHSPQHCQAAQLTETNTEINKHCPDQLCILSEELLGSQFP